MSTDLSTPIQLKDVSLFKNLSPQELSQIKPLLMEKTFEKGEILLLEGDSCERVFIVRYGRVKLFRSSSSGREQILHILEAGDSCACHHGLDCWTCSSSAQALTPCGVWLLRRQQYASLFKSNLKLLNTLNELFAHRLNRLSSLVEEISLANPERRLVKFLLDMLESHQDGLPTPNNIAIPFTHEEISQRLGLVRETVTRHLNRLQRLKLIDIKSRQIVIRNKVGLEKIVSS